MEQEGMGGCPAQGAALGPSCAGQCPGAIPARGNLLAQERILCEPIPTAAAPRAAPALPLTFPPLCPGKSPFCGHPRQEQAGHREWQLCGGTWELQIPQNPWK